MSTGIAVSGRREYTPTAEYLDELRAGRGTAHLPPTPDPAGYTKAPAPDDARRLTSPSPGPAAAAIDGSTIDGEPLQAPFWRSLQRGHGLRPRRCDVDGVRVRLNGSGG